MVHREHTKGRLGWSSSAAISAASASSTSCSVASMQKRLTETISREGRCPMPKSKPPREIHVAGKANSSCSSLRVAPSGNMEGTAAILLKQSCVAHGNPSEVRTRTFPPHSALRSWHHTLARDTEERAAYQEVECPPIVLHVPIYPGRIEEEGMKD